MESINLFGQRLLVKPFETDVKSANGLFMLNHGEVHVTRAEVVSVGDDPGIKVKAGDHIMIDKRTGLVVQDIPEKLKIIDWHTVLAVVSTS